MRRLASALFVASIAGGCMNSAPRQDFGGNVASWDRRSIRNVPGVCGPYGEKMPMSAAAMYGPPAGMPMPPAMMAGGPPMPNPMMPPGMMAQNGMPMMPPPPPGMIQQTAAYGPRGPVVPANFQMGGNPMMGGMQGGSPGAAGMGAMTMNSQPRFPAQRTQVRFARPTGMKVAWYTQGADGKPAYSNTPTDTPGRYNFLQAAIYRLKLSNIEGRPGLEVYPTIEVVPTNPKTESFLAHSSVPVDFTPDDFKQIAEGSYIVKVIYLPDPQFQDAASTGTEEILSTRLEPGVDPIQEACRRGSILLIVRMGNVDQEAPNTPPLNAGTPGGNMNPIMNNFGPMNSGPPGSLVPFGPMGGGPIGGTSDMTTPPGMISAPGNLPPAISSMPLPKTGTPSIGGIPTSRPGTATAVPQSAPAELPPLPPAIAPPPITPPSLR